MRGGLTGFEGEVAVKTPWDSERQLGLGFGPEEPGGETSQPSKKPRRAKPGMYLSHEWRDRRDAVIARTPICESSIRRQGDRVSAPHR